MNIALDRAQIVQAAYFGRAVPGRPAVAGAEGLGAAGRRTSPATAPTRPGARKLLQAAGLTLPVKVTLNVLGSLQQVVDVAQVVQAQMNKAGFDVALNVQEQGRFIQDWRGGNFEAFASLNSGGPDPDDYFGRTFATGGATNVFKYSDPALDKLLTDARARSDPAARKRAVRRGAAHPGLHRARRCTSPTARCSPRSAPTCRASSRTPTRSLRGAARRASIGQ